MRTTIIALLFPAALLYPQAQRVIKTDTAGRIEMLYGDSASLDSFGRLRSSQPVSLHSATFQYGLNPLIWDLAYSGGGGISHVPNESSAKLTLDAVSGATAVIQTHDYLKYQPGKSQLIVISGVMGALKANVRQRIGYFDANNGIFFEQDGTNLKVVRRSYATGTAVDAPVNQSAWNIDKMNGTGASGITIDMAKAQILVIDLQWLGMGRVRIGFDVGGVVYYCHQFLNANVLTTVYMSSADLPVRYEITNTDTAASGTDLLATCSSVTSEGGAEEETWLPFTANNGVTAITPTARRPVLAIRPKTTFASQVNRVHATPIDVEVLAGSNPAFVEFVYNGALTKSAGVCTWASVDANSIMESSADCDAVSGGTVIYSFYLPTAGGSGRTLTSKDLFQRLTLGLDMAGTVQDTFSVIVTPVSGNPVITSAINWKETH